MLIPRNIKQVSNAQYSTRQRMRLTIDAMYNLHEIAYEAPHFVKRIVTFPDLQVICMDNRSEVNPPTHPHPWSTVTPLFCPHSWSEVNPPTCPHLWSTVTPLSRPHPWSTVTPPSRPHPWSTVTPLSRPHPWSEVNPPTHPHLWSTVTPLSRPHQLYLALP